MPEYRIDTQKNDVVLPGRVTFHDRTPLAVIEQIAGEYLRLAQRDGATAVHLVRVHTITLEVIETVAVLAAVPQD